MVPKFRAWDKENDRMIYPSTEGVCFELDDDGINILDVSGDYPEDHTFPAIDSFLMQSTGLKDKNGVEIFEGDVLLHTSSSVNYSDTNWHSYVQVYRIDSGAYRIKGKHIYDTELMSARNRLEVVGNIYQNQNLLDKEYFSTSDGIVEQANKQPIPSAAFEALNNYCQQQNVSPGGSANLLAASFFLLSLENLTSQKLYFTTAK